MTEMIKKILRSLTPHHSEVPINGTKSDYINLSRYILSINQQQTLNDIMLVTADCLITIMNYEFPAVAIHDENDCEIWADSILDEKTLSKLFGNESVESPEVSIHHINLLSADKRQKTDRQLLIHRESIGHFHFTFYLLGDDTELTSMPEAMLIILQAFSHAVTGLKKLSQLESNAFTDHLTGCYNRRWLKKILGISVENARRYKRELSVIMFDIDHFKSVNDHYGHHAGDSVLKMVSHVASSCIRHGDYLIRFGGEEFLIVLPETNQSDAIDISRRIKTHFEDQYITTSEGLNITVTASFGVSSFSRKDNEETLISKADTMLYHAKNNGRNCIMPHPATSLCESFAIT